MSDKPELEPDGECGTDARADRAEQALRCTQARISAILAIADDAIVALDGRMRITLFNEGAEKLFGHSKSDVLGESLDILIPERFRDPHREDVRAFAASGVAARRMGARQTIYGLRKDGSEFPAEASIAQLDESGERIYLAVIRDITERKRIEDLLARSNAELEARVAERTRALEEESRSRELAQAALTQSQRMEAFGQLTGGIAHDFNNMLTIVSGNLELLELRLKEKNERELLLRAAEAAQSGARLTSRLLSFARRQRLEPAVLNLNDLVLGIAELMKRSLGERITLTTVLAGSLWPTKADPSEVENAILNLAINARDAMPSGGKLVIETRNVSVDNNASNTTVGLQLGDCVCVSVTDTGTGMAPDVQSRAFEPFFTTKEGRGTGLGLSTIYGFAKQSGGHVSVQSKLGEGTTVSLYLPRTSGPAKPVTSESELEIPLSENCETILVVEDDPDVREVTLQRVEGLGYVALEAENAEAAIGLLKTETQIALVFSDVILGRGMSGYELGLWVRANLPKLRILLTTGYASEAAGGAHIKEDFEVLHKPYSRLALARALEATLHVDPS